MAVVAASLHPAARERSHPPTIFGVHSVDRHPRCSLVKFAHSSADELRLALAAAKEQPVVDDYAALTSTFVARRQSATSQRLRAPRRNHNPTSLRNQNRPYRGARAGRKQQGADGKQVPDHVFLALYSK